MFIKRSTTTDVKVVASKKMQTCSICGRPFVQSANEDVCSDCAVKNCGQGGCSCRIGPDGKSCCG